MKKSRVSLGQALLRAAAAFIVLSFPFVAGGTESDHSAGRLLVSGLEGAQGSTIGPYGGLYVTEGAVGRISRVNRWTGEVTTFHEGGLPPAVIAIGGVVDVAFIDHQAYALVTLVNPFGGGVDGIYRIDGPQSATVIADIGAFAIANPPDTDFFVPSGVQYSMQPYRGGFLVTDGHHNRIYHVKLNGDISIVRTFENIVPTGLETKGDTIYVAQAGPIPHLPENGKIVAFRKWWPFEVEVAAGARLLVDVERGHDGKLYGLSQGYWSLDPTDPNNAGAPADPGTGAIVRARHGGFDVIADEVNLPTSFEIVGNYAYVISLAGEVWKYDLRRRYHHHH